MLVNIIYVGVPKSNRNDVLGGEVFVLQNILRYNTEMFIVFSYSVMRILLFFQIFIQFTYF